MSRWGPLSPARTARVAAAFSAGVPPAIWLQLERREAVLAGLDEPLGGAALEDLDHPGRRREGELVDPVLGADTTSARSTPSPISASAIVSW